MKNRFAVIYQFEVLEGRQEEFIGAWKALTQLIYQYEGSLGSRLHQSHKHTYIAYAQWPDKKTWENAGNGLPEEAKAFRSTMRECCQSIEILFELNTLEDVLKDSLFI